MEKECISEMATRVWMSLSLPETSVSEMALKGEESQQKSKKSCENEKKGN